MMTTQPVPEYTWRPVQFEDMPALYQLYLAVSGPEDRVESLADLQNSYNESGSDPAVDSLAAFAPGGVMAAYGRCSLHPDPLHECVVQLDYEIHPAYRQLPVEDRLMGWLVTRGLARLQTAPADLPRSLHTAVSDDVSAD